jgi:histidinol-phosphate aminotransferase
MDNRSYAAAELTKLGFVMTDSMTNFLFVSHPDVDGGEIYRALKARGILVRHFDGERIAAYNRITVGTKEQMDTLIKTLRIILEERK